MEKVNDKPVKIGDKLVRYTFRVFDNPSGPEAKRARLYGFLNEFVNQPSLLNCGTTYPEKMAIYHDGTRWVLTAEAETEDL